jgi:hypothetical protein
MRKITLRSLQARIRHVDFVKTGFIGGADFNFVRYSAANSGLLRDIRFYLEGNEIKIDNVFPCTDT